MNKIDKSVIVARVERFIREHRNGDILDLNEEVRKVYSIVTGRAALARRGSVRVQLTHEKIKELFGFGHVREMMDKVISEFYRDYIHLTTDRCVPMETLDSLKRLGGLLERYKEAKSPCTTSIRKNEIADLLSSFLRTVRPLKPLVNSDDYRFLRGMSNLEVRTNDKFIRTPNSRFKRRPTVSTVCTSDKQVEELETIRVYGGFNSLTDALTYCILSHPVERPGVEKYDNAMLDIAHLVKLTHSDDDNYILEEMAWMLRNYQELETRNSQRPPFKNVTSVLRESFIDTILKKDNYSFRFKNRITSITDHQNSYGVLPIDRNYLRYQLQAIRRNLIRSNSENYKGRHFTTYKFILQSTIAKCRRLDEIHTASIPDAKFSKTFRPFNILIPDDVKNDLITFQHHFGFTSFRGAVHFLLDPLRKNW